VTAVAIDGPAGGGKSFVAKAVAQALGFRYLDTGAMYRAVALAALERATSLEDEEAVRRLVEALEIDMDGNEVRVDGRDVSSLLRSKEVTAAAARIAQQRAVRKSLVNLQRELAAGGDVVMEGRDIGSEVLPDADVKIFLTASLGERARRRCRQLGQPEDEATLAEVEADIRRRDSADTNRDVSPLIQAAGAQVVDTTDMSREEVVQKISGIVRGVLEGSR
jgi:cytidylate kinase